MKKIAAVTILLAFAACGSRKDEVSDHDKPKDLKTQIEERLVVLTCECIGPKAAEMEKDAYEAARDVCFREVFPVIMTEFQLTEENMPYKGSLELLAAFDRVKEGLAQSCPGKNGK